MRGRWREWPVVSCSPVGKDEQSWSMLDMQLSIPINGLGMLAPIPLDSLGAPSIAVVEHSGPCGDCHPRIANVNSHHRTPHEAGPRSSSPKVVGQGPVICCNC